MGLRTRRLVQITSSRNLKETGISIIAFLRLIVGMVVLLTVTGMLYHSDANAANIAVLMGADVKPYHQSIEGFRETTRHNVLSTYDMRGDFERGQEILREIESGKDVDLIFAVGVWALKAVILAKPQVPVVYGMVLNPPSVLEFSSVKMTGASMNVPASQILRLIHEANPEIRRLGVIFKPSSTGFLVAEARPIASDLGIEIVATAADSSKQALSALLMLEKQEIDAFWIVPDKVVLDKNVFDQLLLLSYRNNVPLVGLSEMQAKMGSVFAVHFASSKDIGRQAGELADRILAGEPISSLPYTTARKTNLIVNLKAAKKIGIPLSASLIQKATSVIE